MRPGRFEKKTVLVSAPTFGVLAGGEAMRGIDVGTKRGIYKLVAAPLARGRAMVMISSELPEVLRMSHRITGELSARRATREKIMRLAARREAAPTVSGALAAAAMA